jgi:glucose-6-phosphate 1-epimerase
VDGFYLSAPDTILVIDHEKRRTYLLRKKGLPDVVKLVIKFTTDHVT